MRTLARWGREPLVHFALLGALVLVLHRAVAAPPLPREIVVSESLRRGLRSDHLRRTGSPPTPPDSSRIGL